MAERRTQHKKRARSSGKTPQLDSRAHEMIALVCKIVSMRLADAYELSVRSGGATDLPQHWWFKEALKCLAEELRGMERLDPSDLQDILYEYLWPRFEKRLPDPPLVSEDQAVARDLRTPTA